MEAEGHLGHPGRQPLAGADVDGDAGPPPVLHPQPQGDVGLGHRVGGHVGLRPVADHRLAADGPGRVLATHHLVDGLVRCGDVDGLEELDLLVADPVGVHRGGRFHEGEGEHLHDVVLDDVAQRAGRLVEAAPVLHPEALGHRDLHLLDVAAVPDGLEDGVGEPQGDDVLDRLLAHVVVDPVDVRLVEGAVDLVVELEGRAQVAPVGLLHHQAGEAAPGPRLVAAVVGHGLRHQAEHRRDGGQVEEAVAGGAVLPVGVGQLGAQGVERVGVGVLARHVGEAVDHGVPPGAGVGGGLVDGGPELVVRPLGAGHAHHGEAVVERPPVGQLGQGGEDLPGGEVARRAEDDEGDGRRLGEDLGRAHRGVDVSPPAAPDSVV